MTQKTINTPHLSLWDIVDSMQEGWRWLTGGLLIGLACAVAYLLITPKQYEAKALFQGAKVLGSELESSSQIIERLKIATFYDDDQLRVCEITAAEPGVDLVKRINSRVLKNTDILQVSYEGRDNEIAASCLNAVMDRLIRHQGKLAAVSLDKAKRQLELTKAQLAKAEKFQFMLERRSMASIDVADTDVSQMMLLMSTSISKNDQISSLHRSMLDQMASLEPPATRPAELLAPIYVPQSPVSPKKLPVLAGGLFGGLLLGGLASVVMRSWLARKAELVDLMRV